MKRPEKCKVPGNVWFENKNMALANCWRKETEGHGAWFAWYCNGHYHIKPKRSNRTVDA